MRHEPRGLILDVQYPHELVAADALLAAAQEVSGLEPQVQLDVAAFKHGAHGDGELALARAATTQSGPTTLDRRDPVQATAARAHRTMRPQSFLKELEGGGFFVEVRGGKVGHGRLL